MPILTVLYVSYHFKKKVKKEAIINKEIRDLTYNILTKTPKSYHYVLLEFYIKIQESYKK